MKVTVLTSTFPKISETFILHHVTGLIDRRVETQVMAKKSEEKAFTNAEQKGYSLRKRTHYFRKNQHLSTRLGGFWRVMSNAIIQRRWPVISALNIFRYGKIALSLKLVHIAHDFMDAGETDVLHCHFGPNGVTGSYLKQLGLVNKLVVTFHGYDVSRSLKDKRKTHQYEEVYEQADLILPVSDHWRKKLLELGAPADRTIVHRMGINLEYFSFRKRKPHQQPLKIVTAARLTEKKGMKYAIESVAKLKNKKPDIELHYDIIGDGPLRSELEALIEKYQLLDCITMHGAVDLGQVRRLLEEADVFLLPSVTASDGDKEGVPVSLMEAMASGMPVISTWHSGIPELVEDRVSGYLVPERDTDALSDCILYLEENREKWAELGTAGRKKVEEHFNQEKLHNQLVELYQQLY